MATVFEQLPLEPKGAEVVAARTEMSKTYQTGPESFRLCCSLEQTHYRDGATLQEVDLIPEETVNDFLVEKAPYMLRVGKKGVELEYISRQGGTARIRLAAVDGVPVDQLSLNVNPVVEGRRIMFRDLLPDWDVYLLIKTGGVEWVKVLKSAIAPKEYEWVVEEDGLSERMKKQTIGHDSTRDILSRERRTEVLNSIGLSTRIAGRNVYSLTEQFTGRVSQVVDKKTRQKSFTSDLVYPVILDVPDITENIADTADDVSDHTSYGAVTYFDPVDGLSETDSAGIFTTKGRNAGYRFRTVALPGDATVDLANLKLDVFSVTGTPLVTCFGHEVADAALWADTSGNRPYDSTPRTAASATMNFTGTGIKTTNVTTIVQEILDDTAFASGGDMRFACVQQIAAPSGQHFWRAKDISFGSGSPAVLEIDYTEAGGARPQGPLGHPFHGPFAGPIA